MRNCVGKDDHDFVEVERTSWANVSQAFLTNAIGLQSWPSDVCTISA